MSTTRSFLSRASKVPIFSSAGNTEYFSNPRIAIQDLSDVFSAQVAASLKRLSAELHYLYAETEIDLGSNYFSLALHFKPDTEGGGANQGRIGFRDLEKIAPRLKVLGNLLQSAGSDEVEVDLVVEGKDWFLKASSTFDEAPSQLAGVFSQEVVNILS